MKNWYTNLFANILDEKAAVEKELNKLVTISAWQLNQVKNKMEVIEEAQKDKRKVHFAMLLDICHLKNSKLESIFQKYKVESFSEVTV